MIDFNMVIADDIVVETWCLRWSDLCRRFQNGQNKYV